MLDNVRLSRRLAILVIRGGSIIVRASAVDTLSYVARSISYLIKNSTNVLTNYGDGEQIH